MGTTIYRVTVVLLLLVIASTGVYFVWRAEHARHYLPDYALGPVSPLGNDGVISALQMAEIETAVMIYYMRRRELPSSLDDLVNRMDGDGTPFLKEVPSDPWGRPFALEVLGEKEWRIVSDGPDGEPETGDDVVWPK